MAEPEDPVTIGTVVGTHGVRGTVRVKPAGTGDHLREGLAPFVAGARRHIKSARVTPKGFLLDLKGIDDRRVAATLKGEALVLDRAELDPPEPDEFYVGDLVGLAAMDDAGARVGEVAATFETPAHEVLVVRSESGDLLVPFTLEHVPDVDLASGRVRVRPPE